MSSIQHDLVRGARLLRRAPGFAAVAAGTLALGIGARVEMNGIVRRLEEAAAGTAQEEAVVTPLPDAQAPFRMAGGTENAPPARFVSSRIRG